MPGDHAPRPGRAAVAHAHDRARPVAHARARAAVPALLRRRRPRADPAAQRARPRRAGRRPGAAQRAAPDAHDRHHRRHAGRHAAREPAHGRPARHPGRDRSRPTSSPSFDRIATVDVQPHYFGGLLPRVDLVVDHHPEQPGYTAVFKDIRSDYGSTCTILTEHLRAVDVNISERTATAMLYAIKSDTLFFARQTNRVDLEAFTFLYPLADPALIRKMEGAEITLERLEHVTRALATSRLPQPGVLGVPRRDDARGLHPLHGRLPAAGRRREVDDRLRHRRRPAHRQRAQPRLLAQRRRVREGELRRHRQRRRPPRDGQGRGAGRAVPREVRRPVRRRHRRPHRRAGRAVPARRRQTDDEKPTSSRPRSPTSRHWTKPDASSADQAPSSGLGPAPSPAPDRDPRSGRPACSSPTDSRTMPRVTPAAASCSSVNPYCDVSTGRLQRLSVPPRLAARLNDLQPVEDAAGRRRSRRRHRSMTMPPKPRICARGDRVIGMRLAGPG